MIEGIYTVHLTGRADHGVVMFVLSQGKIAGADLNGLVYSGHYTSSEDLIEGVVTFTMPAESTMITGISFPNGPTEIRVPIRLPKVISPSVTYLVQTPIGPINAKFVKNVEL